MYGLHSATRVVAMARRVCQCGSRSLRASAAQCPPRSARLHQKCCGSGRERSTMPHWWQATRPAPRAARRRPVRLPPTKHRAVLAEVQEIHAMNRRALLSGAIVCPLAEADAGAFFEGSQQHSRGHELLGAVSKETRACQAPRCRCSTWYPVLLATIMLMIG